MSQQRIYELGIRDIMAHRFAHQCVQNGIKATSKRIPRKARMYEIECKDVLQQMGLSSEQIRRIVEGMVDRAVSEITVFEQVGRFSTDGATSVALPIVLEPWIEMMNA